MNEIMIYNDKKLTLKVLEEYLEGLSKSTKPMIAITGKGGAIDAEVEMQKRYKKYCGTLLSPIEEQELRVRLNKEMKDGIYRISTDPKDDYITYLG